MKRRPPPSALHLVQSRGRQRHILAHPTAADGARPPTLGAAGRRTGSGARLTARPRRVRPGRPHAAPAPRRAPARAARKRARARGKRPFPRTRHPCARARALHGTARRERAQALADGSGVVGCVGRGLLAPDSAQLRVVLGGQLGQPFRHTAERPANSSRRRRRVLMAESSAAQNCRGAATRCAPHRSPAVQNVSRPRP
jgi:hypothetical protein